MSRLLRDASVTVLDQAMLSLMNFAVGLFLIKNAGKQDYGLYVIAYAVLLYVVSLQNAAITTQLTVIGHRKKGLDLDRFCGALAVGQYMALGPACIVGLMVAIVCALSGLMQDSQAALLAATATATIGLTAREFIRGLLFSQLRPDRVLLLDVAFVAMLVCAILLLENWLSGNLHVLAILVTGATSLIAAVAMLPVVRLPLNHTLQDRVAALREAWSNGRWAVGGVTVTWLQDQSYIYMLGLLSGSGATAEASAARLLLMPVMLLNAAFSRIALPRWSRQRAEGKREDIERASGTARSSFLLIIGLYVAVLLSFGDVVIGFLLTDEYQGLVGLVILWGLVLAVQIVRSNFSLMLQAYERFRFLTTVNAISAAAVVLCGLILIPVFGATGGVAALLVGEMALTLMMAIGWRRAS